MLNERLFGLLEDTFGKGKVTVSSAGTAMQYRYVPVSSKGRGAKRLHRLEISHGGEEYAISCPFCADTRRRCYINHRWGVYDSMTRGLNLWLWHCFNEECQEEYENRKELYRVVCKEADATMDNESLSKATPEAAPRKITWPGDMWMFSDILKKEPSHKAIQYAEDRLYDPTHLAKYFNVGYCGFSHMPNAHDRIIAPVYQDKKMVGWQARLIGDPVSKGIPKWWTSPGMRRSRVLYNLDIAQNYKTKVLVEGPGDVWSFGLPAIGIFGKAMARDQLNLLADRSAEGDTVVVLLDPDQAEDEKAKGRLHHIEKLYRDLSEIPKFQGRVLKVYLPKGYDPGDLDRAYMRRLIKATASAENIDVNFEKIR